MPDYFAGQLEHKAAKLDLEISVTDSANHEEKIDDDITVAEQPILIDLIPEAVRCAANWRILSIIHTTYPDGADAATQLPITARRRRPTDHAVTTDLYGLATFTVTPKSFESDIVDPTRSQRRQLASAPAIVSSLDVIRDSNAVLLRPDKAEYQIGDTLNIDSRRVAKAAPSISM